MTEIATKRCFGISWSATDPKCAGGPDPMYMNEDTGSHDRPKCDFFSACGARRMAMQQEQRLLQARMQQTQQVPMQQVQQPQVQQVQRPAMQQVPTAFQPLPQMMNPMQMMNPTQMLMNPMMNPMQMTVQAPMQLPVQQMMPVNHFMPGYLSMPESQISPGFGGYMGMMGRSIVRAMFKSAGHTVANVLDTNPFVMPQPK